MPDRDIVHNKLPGIYQPCYRQICDGQISDDRLARQVADVSKRRMQRAGTAPFQLLHSAAKAIEESVVGPLFQSETDWAALRANIDRCARLQAQHEPCSARAVNLAVRACREMVADLAGGIPIGNLRQDLMQKYIQADIRADFVDRIPLTDRHYNGVSQEFVNAKLERIAKPLSGEVSYLAQQLAVNHSPQDLRLKPRSRGSERIDVSTPLDEIGR